MSPLEGQHCSKFERIDCESRIFWHQAGLFRDALVVVETSLVGTGADLLEVLSGTPAGFQLRKDIEYQQTRSEQRKAYLATQTPEAIEARRQAKRAAKQKMAKERLEIQRVSQEVVQSALALLKDVSTGELLEFLAGNDVGAPMKTVGGMLYRMLLEYYKATPIRPRDLEILTRFASSHSGHWSKLLRKVSGFPAPSNSAAVPVGIC